MKSDEWYTMLSSASAHQKLICELYQGNEFVLLISNEEGTYNVEFPTLPSNPTFAFDEMIAALEAYKASLFSRIEPEASTE